MESGDAAVVHAVDAHSGELEGHGRLLGDAATGGKSGEVMGCYVWLGANVLCPVTDLPTQRV